MSEFNEKPISQQALEKTETIDYQARLDEYPLERVAGYRDALAEFVSVIPGMLLEKCEIGYKQLPSSRTVKLLKQFKEEKKEFLDIISAYIETRAAKISQNQITE